MNLFENLVDKVLVKAPLLLKITEALESLATEVHKLGVATMMLAHQVQTHHNALQELYARQGLVMQAIKSNSLDMKMPDPDEKEGAPKPN